MAITEMAPLGKLTEVHDYSFLPYCSVAEMKSDKKMKHGYFN